MPAAAKQTARVQQAIARMAEAPPLLSAAEWDCLAAYSGPVVVGGPKGMPARVPFLHLKSLEQSLHEPAVRKDSRRLDSLLHEDFYELGRSGRGYSKQTIMTRLATELPGGPIVVDTFAVQPMGKHAALVSYRSAEAHPDGSFERHTLRMSLWEWSPAGWKMRFHAGVPCEPFVPSSDA